MLTFVQDGPPAPSPIVPNMSSEAPTSPVAAFAELAYRDGAAAVDWLEQALGFERLFVVDGEGGGVLHAELACGSTVVMLESVGPGNEYGMRSPLDLPGTSGCVCIAVDDPDQRCAQAREAGGIVVTEPFDTPYGARSGVVRDPEGHVWVVSTHRPHPPRGSH